VTREEIRAAVLRTLGEIAPEADPATLVSDVPFRDHVWPKFLRENALRVFKL